MISVKTVCRPDVPDVVDTVVLHLLIAGAELQGAHRLSLRQLRHLDKQCYIDVLWSVHPDFRCSLALGSVSKCQT